MKSITSTIAILITLTLALDLAAQGAPVVLTDASMMSSEEDEDNTSQSQTDDEKPEASPTLEGCDARKARISRSAARKMLRAIETKEKIVANGLGKTIEVEIDGANSSLMVLPEYEGQVAALIKPGHNRSWVVTVTDEGPIVARLDWTDGCTIETTRLMIPEGPEIAFEPFRYWGARVQWRLPEDRLKGISIVKAIQRAARN